MDQTNLVDALVVLSSIAMLTTVLISGCATIGLIALLNHFAATRPIGATTAKLAEKELDLQRQIHEDRTEDNRQHREMLAQMRDATADEIIG